MGGHPQANQTRKRSIFFKVGFFIFAVAVIGGYYFFAKQDYSIGVGPSDNPKGWIWNGYQLAGSTDSIGLGWTSMNCLNDFDNDNLLEYRCDPTTPYGVSMSLTGALDGVGDYLQGCAWSSAYGWVCFNGGAGATYQCNTASDNPDGVCDDLSTNGVKIVSDGGGKFFRLDSPSYAAPNWGTLSGAAATEKERRAIILSLWQSAAKEKGYIGFPYTDDSATPTVYADPVNDMMGCYACHGNCSVTTATSCTEDKNCPADEQCINITKCDACLNVNVNAEDTNNRNPNLLGWDCSSCSVSQLGGQCSANRDRNTCNTCAGYTKMPGVVVNEYEIGKYELCGWGWHAYNEGVTYDTISHSGSASQNCGAGNCSFNVTIPAGPATNRVVLVGIYTELGATITDVKFNNVPMIKLNELTSTPVMSGTASLWYLLDSSLPSAGGAYPVTVTNVGGGIQMVAGAEVLKGVRQAAPETQNQSFVLATNTITTNITTLTNNAWVVGFAGTGEDKILTPNAAQTPRWGQSIPDPLGAYAAMSTKSVALAGATSMNWTTSVSVNRIINLVASFPPALISSKGLGWIAFNTNQINDAAYIDVGQGSILSGGSIYSPAAPPTNRYNAAYIIEASGDIINWYSQNYLRFSRGSQLPKFLQEIGTSDVYKNVLGKLDYKGLITDADPAAAKINKYGSTLEDSVSVPIANVFNAPLADKTFYYNTSQTIAAGAAMTIPVGVSGGSGAGVIVVDGDLTIARDIDYSALPIGKLRELPSVVWIIRGDLIIDPLVTKIAGTFIVLGDGNPAKCAELTEAGAGCGRFGTGTGAVQLVIKGAVLAKQFNFERTFSTGGEPSEKFSPDGRLQANTPSGLKDFVKSVPRYTSG